jgi:hypothetical protein
MRAGSLARSWRDVALTGALVGGLLCLGACGVVDLGSEATETWTKHYTLNHGGVLAVRNTNGRVEVVAGDGDAVDVTATKVARAMSDDAAKDAVKQIKINENVSGDRIALESTMETVGFSLSNSRRVDYVVHLPRWANVDLRSTNGQLTIRDLAGTLKASTTNGAIDGEGLSGGAKASATNGRIQLDFQTVGTGDIVCDTTNGRIALTLPSDAKASLSANVTNGGISTDGLNLNVSDKSRRRLEGTLNGGGTVIRLEATNGSIGVKGR